MKPAKLAYIMSRFPGLSETFILREMNALKSLGWELALYPLIVQTEKVVHSGVDAWMAHVNKIPWISPGLLWANICRMAREPKLYFSLLAQTLRENSSSFNFLARAIAIFPRAVLMAEKMRTEGIRHIHAHFSTHPALAAWLVHKLTGIPYSVTVHAHDIFVRREMLGTKLRDAVFIVAISEFNREFLVQHLGEGIREKIHIIHCGVDPAMYQRAHRKELQGSERFDIISVGGLRPYKGMSFLVEACAMLLEKGLPVNCKIVGEGEERPRIEALIKDRKMTGNVELLGAKTQTEVAQLLAAADCYAQPSMIASNGKMEGIPVALMEAMASGLPVIASELSGIPELVIPGKTGYLVPPANAFALAQALERVYTNPEEATLRAKAGRTHVLRQFDLGSNAQVLSSLYEKSLLSSTSMK